MISRSFARSCWAVIVRTVPERERIESDSVVAPSGPMYCTPASISPAVTPVAAKCTSSPDTSRLVSSTSSRS